MLLAGIISQRSKIKTANLIKSIFMSTGKKVSIIDFIGNDIDKYIEQLKSENTEILILKIGINEFETKEFQKFKFDILILEDMAEDLSKEQENCIIEKLISLLKFNACIIVNTDNFNILNKFNLEDYFVVTYGFNSKASLSTSSIGDLFMTDSFMCFLRKTIHTKNGLIFEPQEYVLKIPSLEKEPYNILAAASFAIINGIDLNDIKNIY